MQTVVRLICKSKISRIMKRKKLNVISAAGLAQSPSKSHSSRYGVVGVARHVFAYINAF